MQAGGNMTGNVEQPVVRISMRSIATGRHGEIRQGFEEFGGLEFDLIKRSHSS